VDLDRPGDRKSVCRGLMRPLGMVFSKKGWQIVFRCERCGARHRNRVATDTDAPDSIDALARLAKGHPAYTPARTRKWEGT